MLKKRMIAGLIALLTFVGLALGLAGPAAAAPSRSCNWPISSSSSTAYGDAVLQSSASGWRVTYLEAAISLSAPDAHINAYWYAGNTQTTINTLYTGAHVAGGDNRVWIGASSWVNGGLNPYVRVHFHKNSDLTLYMVMTLHPNGGSTCTYFNT